MSASREHVMRALGAVVDPELGLSVGDLGLVYGVEIDGGLVRIVMTLTTQGCPLRQAMTEWVRAAVAALPGVEEVGVFVTFDPPWTPERISAAAGLGTSGAGRTAYRAGG
jgi:metal-sulfur cluster biosynthetic enzyme